MGKGKGRGGARTASLGPSHAPRPKAAPIARPSSTYEEMLKHRAYGGSSKEERDAIRKQEAEARQNQRETGEQVDLGKSGEYWKKAATSTCKARPAEAPVWAIEAQKASWSQGSWGASGGKARGKGGSSRRSLTPPPSFAPSGRGPWQAPPAKAPGLWTSQPHKAAGAAAAHTATPPRSGEDPFAAHDPWQKGQPSRPPAKASAALPPARMAFQDLKSSPPAERGVDPLAAEDPWTKRGPAVSKAAVRGLTPPPSAPRETARRLGEERPLGAAERLGEPARLGHSAQNQPAGWEKNGHSERQEDADPQWDKKAQWWDTHDRRDDGWEEDSKWKHDARDWKDDARWTNDKWEESELSAKDREAVDKCVKYFQQASDLDKAIKLVQDSRSGVSTIVAEAAIAKVRRE